MSRRRMCDQHQITQAQTLAIGDRARHVHRRERESIPVFRVVTTAVLEQRSIPGTRDHLCTRVVRELCQAAGMIGMRVRIEDPPDVAQAYAEGLNVRFDQWSVSRHAAIDQDVTRGRGDEEYAEALGPHVPGIAIDPEWLLRSRPGGVLRDVLPLRRRSLRTCALDDQEGKETRSSQQAHGQPRLWRHAEVTETRIGRTGEM